MKKWDTKIHKVYVYKDQVYVKCLLTQGVKQKVKLKLKGSCFRWSCLYKCCSAHHWMRFGFRWSIDYFKGFLRVFFKLLMVWEVGCWLTQVELQRTCSLVRRFVVSQCVTEDCEVKNKWMSTGSKLNQTLGGESHERKVFSGFEKKLAAGLDIQMSCWR